MPSVSGWGLRHLASDWIIPAKLNCFYALGVGLGFATDAP
jgi:hypothetical protein